MELPSCLNTFPTRGMFSANAGFVIHTVENTAAAAVSPKAVLYTVLNFLCDFAVPVDFFPEPPVDFSVDFSCNLCTIFSVFSVCPEAAAISLILENASFFASSACFGNGKSACMISSITLSFLLFFSLSKSNFFAIITSSLSCTYRYTSCYYRSCSHISILVFRKLFCYTCKFSVFLFLLLQSFLLNIIFC